MEVLDGLADAAEPAHVPTEFLHDFTGHRVFGALAGKASAAGQKPLTSPSYGRHPAVRADDHDVGSPPVATGHPGGKFAEYRGRAGFSHRDGFDSSSQMSASSTSRSIIRRSPLPLTR